MIDFPEDRKIVDVEVRTMIEKLEELCQRICQR